MLPPRWRRVPGQEMNSVPRTLHGPPMKTVYGAHPVPGIGKKRAAKREMG
jgi:hypothetical protein